MSITFTDTERAILRIVQDSLPDSPRPYADIAAAVGVEEAEVLEFLRRLKQEGIIRRLGVSIRHHKAGYAHNVMVAWNIAEADKDAAGSLAAEYDSISHCYYRPSAVPDWPYTLYTMIHGRTPEECLETVRQLRARSPLFREYAALPSVAELKKASLRYF